MQRLRQILHHEATGGVLMMLAAALAILIANSPAAALLQTALQARLSITLNGVGLSKDLLLWINDGLMAVFFFRIGLELKHELVEGRLRRASDVVLPGFAALCGMAVPALLFLGVVGLTGASDLTAGWAIPCATDIAFALGVVALAGPRVSPGMKAFLLTLAILDDLGAILIIAAFYGHDLHLTWLVAALVPLALMIALNFARVRRLGPSLLLAVLLWFMVLQSGVHATIAGVIAAFCIPLRDRQGGSPLHDLDKMLAPYVTFFIVPVFALANAGVSLAGFGPTALADPLTLAILAGLVLGKPLGVILAVWLLLRLNLARLPEGATWAQVCGVACLAGIGFTMSLFIGGLSFGDGPQMNAVRLGVLTASVLAALAGFAVLWLGAGKTATKAL
jgi:Na+:H+ antiporter, NhaA family